MTISAKRRAGLPRSDFALPEKRAYPIDTEKRGRAALSYGSRFATPSEYRQIRRRVLTRYPDIDRGRKNRLTA